jgi:hypothetical protein
VNLKPSPTIAATITLTSSPGGKVAITPDGKYVYAASGNNPTNVDVIPVDATVKTQTFSLTNPSGSTVNAIAMAPPVQNAGIAFQSTGGLAINNILSGGGVAISSPTNQNVVQNCSASNSQYAGFTMMTTGTANLQNCSAYGNAINGFNAYGPGVINLNNCIANNNIGYGFDMAPSTGTGLVQQCSASQNSVAGFNDVTYSAFNYTSCAAQRNGVTPSQSLDSNYTLTGSSMPLQTTSVPYGPSGKPYYQFGPNGSGSGFTPTYWNNITLP